MSLQITTPPEAEPVTVAEVKARLYLTTTADDSKIAGLITVARAFAERTARVSLVSKTYTYTRPGFPWPVESLRLPVPPVSAVNSVSFLDSDEVTWTVWDASEYLVGLSQFPAIIRPKSGFTYPSPACSGDLDTVKIEFVSGPAVGALQLDFSQNYEGIRQLAVHFYEHPSAVNSENLKEMPLGLQALLTNNKLQVF